MPGLCYGGWQVFFGDAISVYAEAGVLENGVPVDINAQTDSACLTDHQSIQVVARQTEDIAVSQVSI